ncbi:calcium:proton antiporter [Sulfurovum sp. bin170]|uniref:calcium:proton antiporter n=1 Tax=Sulfurovum sp. bin170 TaxID=2695268 RepID=UPI0013E0AFC5|nr:calcium:proton antiporter [Sulfurovum sp. bin170]NEW61489.1 calcium:proton antiporter [Sulfurovum sp. bin170]
MLKDISKEYALFVTLISLVLFTIYEHTLAHTNMGNIVGFSILFAIIIYASLSVAHHAEMLAEKFGEPYGTLILTMSAVTVEVMIIAIMMLQSENPTLARDTIYSAIMLDINGLLGVAAIIGGLKFGEQPYNVDSSNSYLSMLLVAIGLSMVLPHFIGEEHLSIFMLFTVVVFILLYLVFTKIQLNNHKYFFEYKGEDDECESGACHTHREINAWYHAILLVVYILMIGFLSEILSVFMGNNLQELGLPLTLGAVGVAVISASPELIVAFRAALDNRMQTVINIALGASLATILLTVPAVIIISMIAGVDIELAITPVQGLMLGLTLLVSMVNFNDGETNMLEGFLHFILFIVFAFVLFV